MFSELKSNKQVAALDTAKQHSSTSHGHTLVAFSMISPLNTDLKVTALFDSDSLLRASAEQILSVLLITKENKVLFRSYNDNGKFLQQYAGCALTNSSKNVSSSDEYVNGSKLIMDIECTDHKQVWKFYRIHENNPRELTLIVKS